MPFYIKQSVSVGPFRFNLSKGGIGVSAGITGFRIGTGPRGHYVHAGRGGLYYRSSLGGAGGSPRSAPPQPQQHTPGNQPRPASYAEPNVDMIAVSSASVLEMTDERYANLLAELNEKHNAMSMLTTLTVAIGAFTILATILAGPIALAVGLVALIIGAVIGSRLDATGRSVVVMYDLDPDAAAAYEALTKAFDHLAASRMKWHIDAGGQVRDIHTWKRNSGATTILDKRPTVFGYALPRVLKSNVTPPSMQVGKETLYWLPDVILVVESGKVGAVAYDRLHIQWQDSRFIEEGSVPADAEVIGQTWKYPNKNGGPDRRFANNFQIPICRYETIHLRSGNGLNELLQVSTNGRTQPLSAAAERLAATIGANSDTLALPSL